MADRSPDPTDSTDATDPTDPQVACFEAGIKFGSLYHQFAGTPVSPDSAASLARAMEESIENQPHCVDVTVDVGEAELAAAIDADAGYTELTGRFLTVEIVVDYEGVEVVTSMAMEDGYPLMQVEEVRKERRQWATALLFDFGNTPRMPSGDFTSAFRLAFNQVGRESPDMSQSTLSDDDLFGEAASEMREDVEASLDDASAALPDGDDIWRVDADNTLGVLNALRSALDVGDAQDHLRDAKKWYTMGERADAFDDAEDLADRIEETESILADVAEAHEQVGELTGTIPQLRSQLEDAAAAADAAADGDADEAEDADPEADADGGAEAEADA